MDNLDYNCLIKTRMFEDSEVSPQKSFQSALRAVVTQASRQKLLPKIMWKADREFGSKKLLNYQKSIRKQYENDLKAPLKYDPEAAKSEREKFREKVIKLVNNQLEVDYFDNIKKKGGMVVTYKGHQIQECKVQTKKQFQMFKNFNEKRFKQTYSNLFEDRLELEYDSLLQKKMNRRCHTFNVLEPKAKINSYHFKTEESPEQARQRHTEISLSAPKTERKKNLLGVDSKKKVVLKYNEKKVVGKEIPHHQQTNVLQIMKQIGGFSNHFQSSNFSLTRESINRWLKSLYQKSHRILDFLQIKDVVTFEEFWQISKRLRVMPLNHILFMTFLYYDGNNDGYICDYDLDRLTQLSLKRPIIAHDCNKLKQSNIKKILSKREAYLDLYKLSQVTETIFFDWKKQKEEAKPAGLEVQMKNRLLTSKQKQIFLDFEAFCSVYKFEKPFLWYDLMYVFGGVSFQGLRYD